MSTKLAMRAGIGTLVLLFALSALALGAKREDPDAAGELYGDLYVIERDGNGEPVLRDVTYTDPGNRRGPGHGVLPATIGLGLLASSALGRLQGELVPPVLRFRSRALRRLRRPRRLRRSDSGGQLRPRQRQARAQDFVIDSAYAEFLKTINEAVAVGFDPAGRIRLGLPPGRIRPRRTPPSGRPSTHPSRTSGSTARS